ncbi:hypothetical protein ASG21_08400 [Chryseobacterium sp. Leaf394]|nr:hypothetical protein ASG21_08400 [Chryseobacterium sp. Leaf394]
MELYCNQISFEILIFSENAIFSVAFCWFIPWGGLGLSGLRGGSGLGGLGGGWHAASINASVKTE